ncbi:MAG: hypothetical protein H0U54_06430 [Acidobacteria bacterium]|nr:hypothetical protein [Acidobacteriota bacterium]
MSCRNVETIITELARGQMLDARVKEDALSHIQGCEPCAARFADEQTLTSGLRAVAASGTSVETPARVEAALLSAFRQGVRSSPFIPANAPARPLATPWLPWSIAAAAAILIFSVFALPRLLPTDTRELAGRGAREVQPAPRLSPIIETTKSASVQKDAEIQPDDEVVRNPESELAGGSSLPRSSDRRRAIMQTVGLRSKPIRSANNIQPPVSMNEEVTTDFLPLTYGSLSQFDDGQVVRVELPHSALQSLGLPMNAERGSERVKADVLLGHDGVARAIRFVR